MTITFEVERDREQVFLRVYEKIEGEDKTELWALSMSGEVARDMAMKLSMRAHGIKRIQREEEEELTNAGDLEF